VKLQIKTSCPGFLSKKTAIVKQFTSHHLLLPTIVIEPQVQGEPQIGFPEYLAH